MSSRCLVITLVGTMLLTAPGHAQDTSLAASYGSLSLQGNLTNGIVSALSGFGDDLSQFQITAPIQPGNSGGPVMNRAGHIVGVVVASANDEFFREQRGTAVQNLNFAIQDALGRAFLDTHNVDYLTAEQPGETLAIADIAEQARHFTGQILCYQ